MFIYYRIVSCSGTAHLPRLFSSVFSFRMTTDCLSWLERITAHRVNFYISIPVRDKPSLRCLACLSHTLCLPSLLLSLSQWRHSILPPLALAPLALSHHSAAGLTGSDVCQRLVFSCWALEV